MYTAKNVNTVRHTHGEPTKKRLAKIMLGCWDITVFGDIALIISRQLYLPTNILSCETTHIFLVLIFILFFSLIKQKKRIKTSAYIHHLFWLQSRKGLTVNATVLIPLFSYCTKEYSSTDLFVNVTVLPLHWDKKIILHFKIL
jgi:hypothetical protein